MRFPPLLIVGSPAVLFAVVSIHVPLRALQVTTVIAVVCARVAVRPVHRLPVPLVLSNDRGGQGFRTVLIPDHHAGGHVLGASTAHVRVISVELGCEDDLHHRAADCLLVLPRVEEPGLGTAIARRDRVDFPWLRRERLFRHVIDGVAPHVETVEPRARRASERPQCDHVVSLPLQLVIAGLVLSTLSTCSQATTRVGILARALFLRFPGPLSVAAVVRVPKSPQWAGTTSQMLNMLHLPHARFGDHPPSARLAPSRFARHAHRGWGGGGGLGGRGARHGRGGGVMLLRRPTCSSTPAGLDAHATMDEPA
jgi:hypothetical protein